MSAKKVVLWFKNDLRLLDNETLVIASQNCEALLPVYIFDPRFFEKTELGFPKAGKIRFEFLKQTVEVLRKNLQKRHSNLLILTGHPEELLPELMKKYNLDSLYAEQEYASEELRVVNSILDKLSPEYSCHFIWGKTLYHIDDIPYTIETIPMTSKAFRINTTKKAEVRETFEIPATIPTLELDNWGELPTYEEFNFNNDTDGEEPFVMGGEDLY